MQWSGVRRPQRWVAAAVALVFFAGVAGAVVFDDGGDGAGLNVTAGDTDGTTSTTAELDPLDDGGTTTTTSVVEGPAPTVGGGPVTTVSTPAAPKPTTTTLPFGTVKSVQTGVYIVNVDGTGLRRMSDVGFLPAWSPDGTKVAFIGKDGDVVVTTLDGKKTVVGKGAVMGRDNLSWDPTSRFVAYPGTGDGHDRDIWVASAGGPASAARRLAHPGDDAGVAWGSGNRLAVIGTSGLFTTNPEGTDWKRLYDEGLNFGIVRWSPDAARIAVIPDQQPNHFIVSADGSNMKMIGAAKSESFNVRGAWWSPDGAKLVIESYDKDSTKYGVWTVNAADGVVGPWVSEDTDPAWSPRGDLFAAIAGSQPTNRSVVTMRPDGSGRKTMVAHATGMVSTPRFSPDGAKLVFAATPGG